MRTSWLFPEDFQLKILTAYDYLGQWTLASRLYQELYAIWNSSSIPGYRQKTLWVCVEVELDGTKKLITAVPQHALNSFGQVSFGDNMLACVAVVSVSFKPSGASARGHWAKRSKKVGAGFPFLPRPSPPLLLFCSFLPNALARLPRLA